MTMSRSLKAYTLFYLYKRSIKVFKPNNIGKVFYSSKCKNPDDKNVVVVEKQVKEVKKVVSEKAKDAYLRGILSKEYQNVCGVRDKMPTIDATHIIAVDETGKGKRIVIKEADVFKKELTKDEFAQAKGTAVDKKPKGKDKAKKQEKKEEKKEEVGYEAPSGPTYGGSGGGPRRPIRREYPAPVVLGVFPKEWMTYFMPITGVTGFYTFLFTASTFLVSKEYYVLEHNYYNGLSVLLGCVLVAKYLGPHMAKWLDDELDAYEATWNKGRNSQKATLNSQIDNEKKLLWCIEGQLIVVDKKRENVHLQLEAEYRQRFMQVYQGVKRRLDYHLEVHYLKNKFVHKNLVQWVLKEVEKAITPDLKQRYLMMCVDEMLLLVKELEKNIK